MEQRKISSIPLELIDPPIKWEIGDKLTDDVFIAAMCTEGRRPGLWKKMMIALHDGAAGTMEGTVDAFLFRAMVDRLLEEFHKLYPQENG